jgi:hypothetical protein
MQLTSLVTALLVSAATPNHEIFSIHFLPLQLPISNNIKAPILFTAPKFTAAPFPLTCVRVDQRIAAAVFQQDSAVPKAKANARIRVEGVVGPGRRDSALAGIAINAVYHDRRPS